MARGWTLFGAALLWPVALPVSAQAVSGEPEIRAARKASNDAIRRRDVKAYAEHLAEDFVQVRGNGSFVPSRQASIDRFARDFGDPRAIRFERITDKVEISKAAPVAAEHGHWIGTRPDGSRAFGGTYLAMWRQTTERWKIRSEIYVVLECFDAEACAAYRERAK